jgi:phosphatidyl-myo-inositol alpha-mannosyltransferase
LTPTISRRGALRIGLVCPYDLSLAGGVQDQVTGLARALSRLGLDVETIAPGPVDDGTGIGRTFGFRVNGSIAPMAPQPAAGFRAVRAIRRGRFDIVHLHEPLAPSITIPVLLDCAVPMVGTFHAAGERTPYRWFAPPLRALARRLDVRVAVSEPAAALARRHLGGTYHVFFNGIDPTSYASPSGGSPEVTGAGPSAAADARSNPTVMFLGRHEPRKGLAVLLAAGSRLPANVTLLIAGNGTDTGPLRRVHGDNPRVRWLGRLSDSDKIGHLGSAAVLCAPSLYGESFGIVVLEAMAAGVPVVASDLPGYRHLTDNGAAAVLVPPDDPVALAAGLIRVLTDHDLASTLRERGRIRARDYSMGELSHRYLALYEQLLSRSV